MITRRSLIAGLLAAPAIVRIDSIMPVRSLRRLASPWTLMSSYKAGDIVGIGFDSSTGRVFVCKNGVWQGLASLSFREYWEVRIHRTGASHRVAET